MYRALSITLHCFLKLFPKAVHPGRSNNQDFGLTAIAAISPARLLAP
jgi:hypothetical protein